MGSKKQLRRRSDCRIDVARALQLRFEQHLTLQEIAEIYGVSRQSVHTALAPYRELLANPAATAAYRQHEAAILDALRFLLVRHMANPEVLGKASLNNAAFAFSKIHEASRLIRGQSTSNQATWSRVVRDAAEPPSDGTSGDPR